jgi:putative transposase
VGMLPVIHALLVFVASLVRSRRLLHLTVLTLQHQVAVYQRSGCRPQLHPTDRFLWVWLSRRWTGWQDTLVFVHPRTVIAWQRKRFREHWRQRSQGSTPGRPTISQDVQELIRKMSQANPLWGAPRIGGALRNPGIDVAKSTVAKYRIRSRKPPSPTWRAFLKTHVIDLVSVDCFVVPTVGYKVLFVLIILAHHRRHVVHFNVTEHPTAQWTAQQVVDTFPGDAAPRYLGGIAIACMARHSRSESRIWTSKKW